MVPVLHFVQVMFSLKSLRLFFFPNVPSEAFILLSFRKIISLEINTVC